MTQKSELASSVLAAFSISSICAGGILIIMAITLAVKTAFY